MQGHARHGFLTKVTIDCGPFIYMTEASTVASSDSKELATLRNIFSIKKLGLLNNK